VPQNNQAAEASLRRQREQEFELTSRILKPKRKLKPSALLLAPFCPGSLGNEVEADIFFPHGYGVLKDVFIALTPVHTGC